MAKVERNPLKKKYQEKVGILPAKYSDLHMSASVRHAVAVTEKRGTKIPNDPSARLDAYLNVLDARYDNEKSREALINHFIIAEKDVPSTLDAEEIREQQRSSLEKWVNHLTHPKVQYPAWFKYYVLRNVVQMGTFDAKTQQFGKRSKTTTASFPSIRRPALANIYEAVSNHLQGITQEYPEDEKLVELAADANFSRMYGHAIGREITLNPEIKKITEGEWKKYTQGVGPEGEKQVEAVIDDLEGRFTDWCTIYKKDSRPQIAAGDLYVYYTKNLEGQTVVPRAAIRIDAGMVDEVRGIEKDQELEAEVVDTVVEKLQELPGAERFIEAAKNVKRIHEIDKKHWEEGELSVDELRYIYEIEKGIHTLGFEKHPLIKAIQEERDAHEDFAVMFDCREDQIVESSFEATDDTVVILGSFGEWLDTKSKRTKDMPASLRYVRGDARFAYKTTTGKLEGVGGNAYFSLSPARNLGNIRRVGGNLHLRESLVMGMGEMRTVGGDLVVNGLLGSLGDVEEVDGSLDCRNSRRLRDTGKVRRIGNDALFDNSRIRSMDGVEHIGGNATFYNAKHLTSLGSTCTSIDGSLYLDGSNVRDTGSLRRIGMDGMFNGSKLQSLGGIISIGGGVSTRDSWVEDLGDLQNVGHGFDISRSRVRDLGSVQSIGGPNITGNEFITSEQIEALLLKNLAKKQVSEVTKEESEINVENAEQIAQRYLDADEPPVKPAEPSNTIYQRYGLGADGIELSPGNPGMRFHRPHEIDE